MSFMSTGPPDEGFPDHSTAYFQQTNFTGSFSVLNSAASKPPPAFATFPRQRPNSALLAFNYNDVDILSASADDLGWNPSKGTRHYDWPRFVPSINRAPRTMSSPTSIGNSKEHPFGISAFAVASTRQQYSRTRETHVSSIKKSTSVLGNRASIDSLWPNPRLPIASSVGSTIVTSDRLADPPADPPSQKRRVRFGDVQYLLFYAYETIESQSNTDMRQVPVDNPPFDEPPAYEMPSEVSLPPTESCEESIHPLAKFSRSSAAHSSPNLSTADISDPCISPLQARAYDGDSENSDEETYGVPSPVVSPNNDRQLPSLRHWTSKARSTLELVDSISLPDISKRASLVEATSLAPLSNLHVSSSAEQQEETAQIKQEISRIKSKSRFSWPRNFTVDKPAGESMGRVERRLSQLIKRTSQLTVSGLWR